MAKPNSSDKRSWRDIQQRDGSAPRTRIAKEKRLRLYLRGLFGVFLLVSLVTGVMAIRYFTDKIGRVPQVLHHTLLQLDFRSDGVLEEAWFRSQFSDHLMRDLRSLRVHDLKAELEAFGQIAHAAVAVQFPSVLLVQLTEREPILRARVRGADGQPMTLLVARDGTLYHGMAYPEWSLRNLPALAGLRLNRTEAGQWLPIDGIDEVAALLDLAHARIPALARHWRIVHLDRWHAGRSYRPSLVRIQSRSISEILFSMQGLEAQFQRLEAILEHSERNRLGLPSSIDLSYPNESVVRYP